jgi:hypothetical protein
MARWPGWQASCGLSRAMHDGGCKTPLRPAGMGLGITCRSLIYEVLRTQYFVLRTMPNARELSCYLVHAKDSRPSTARAEESGALPALRTRRA